MRAVIVTTLFLMLFTAALMLGGHAAIDPILRMATAARDSGSTGDVIYTMPDGKFCRHMTLDNATGEMVEGTVEACQNDIVRGQFRRSVGSFTWGGR
jgi:hypothetical protein